MCYKQVVARRQTFWDTAIQLITSQSQESNLLTAFVRLICTAVINFTAGMLCSIFLFAFQLPSMVMSYQVSSYTHHYPLLPPKSVCSAELHESYWRPCGKVIWLALLPLGQACLCMQCGYPKTV